MPIRIKRKLYPRGGSYETTIPIQMLFSLDMSKKHNVVFEYDPKNNRWQLHFEERKKH